MTIFKKIIEKKIPAQILYEDDRCIAIRDIDPKAPVHLLLIPKREIPSLAELRPEDAELMGHLIVKASEIARDAGLAEKGYRLVVNTKADAGQTVDHLHLHILGGRALHWPPG